MATQSQALHAGTIQTQLLAEKSETETTKRGFWSKLFRKENITNE